MTALPTIAVPASSVPTSTGPLTVPPTELPLIPMSEPSAGAPFPQTKLPANPIRDSSADSPPAVAMEVSAPTVAARRLADAILLLRAEALSDLEATRIANENRLRALRHDYGLTEGTEHDAQADLVDAMGKLEHQAELELKRALRRHPLGAWVKSTQGVGEKQGARLIASIGDPYWHSVLDRPRLVSELWAYAGLHVLHPGHRHIATRDTTAGVQPDLHPGHVTSGTPHETAGMDSNSDTTGQRDVDDRMALAGGVAPRRQRGQKANWNGAVKMRAYLVAESCVKKRDSPYRPVYDNGRSKYDQAVHNHPCARCGPAGKPAPPGSPLSAGHQHARAMRLVMKAVLRDLWAESKRLHEEAA